MDYHQALDTFVAELPDGTSARVAAGEVLPEGHPLVRHDQEHGGTLFRKLNSGDEAPPPKRARASAKAQAS